MRRAALHAMLALAVVASPALAGTRFAVRARTFDGKAWHEDALVVVEGSRIASVTAAIGATPADAIATPNAVLTPGLVDADSALGVFQGREESQEALSPDLLVADAFAPDRGESDALRRSGVTLAWLSAGPRTVLGGWGALVQPAAGAALVLDARRGMSASLMADASDPERAPTSRAEQARQLATAASGAMAGLPGRVRFDDAGSARLARGIPGQVPVGLPVSPEAIAELEGGGVVLSGLDARTPLDVVGLAAELARAQPFALGSGDAPAGPRAVRLAAARLVAAGVPRDRVLAALTSEAATMAGETERGRIEPGRIADLVLWTGDPTSPSSRVLRAWVGGVEVFRAP